MSIHLNTRTGFSFLRAYGTIQKVVDRAKSIGCDTLGVADYMSTWGHIPLQKACKQAGIRAVFGVSLPVVVTLDKDPRYDVVTLIATAETPEPIYKALERARTQMFYRPRLTWNQVAQLRDHGGVKVIVEHVRIDTIDIPERQDYPVALKPVAGHMLGLIKSGAVKPIAAVGAMMPRREDREGYNMLTSINNMAKIGDVEFEPQHMMTDKEYEHALKTLRVDSDIINAAIARSIEWVGSTRETVIPAAKNVEPDYATLEDLCREGAQVRGLDVEDGPYAERLRLELETIRAKEFETYFLFVADLVAHAKKHMLVGPGRGSSGGSLVCYLLGITEVDPLVHGTLFNRFIDITRSDWPDIDVDFPDRSRHMVLEYLLKTYGGDKVAKLGTVTDFQAKSSLNDTARALQVPWETVRLVQRLMTDDMSLEEAFEDPGIAMAVEQFPNFKRAMLLEDHPRHSGVHAAGIVVAADPITRYASVDDENVAALTLKDAEDIGLLKMDALGLRMLSVIEDCCEAAGISWGDHLYSMPLDDDNVYELFRKDMMTGIFQFEGPTVRGLTRQIHVDRFTDLCALTSLARPGPLEGGAAEAWVKRRNGEEETSFEHDSLAPLLGDTYGTIIYQEQMMKVVSIIADFSVEDTNKFRRAIGKKLPEELAKFREQFIERAGAKVGEKVAASLWHQMEESGRYAFNLSHAVAYSMLSYLTAYMKVYHPLEFALAQLLNSKGQEHTVQMLQELHRDEIEVVSFDPERSLANWSIQDGQLVGGFNVVKGIGDKTAIKCVETREIWGDAWRAKVGAGVLKKIEDPENWSWADVGRVQRKLKRFYEDPDNFICDALPDGISKPGIRIADIGQGKGTYLIAGVCIKKQLRNSNDPERVAKRGGQKNSGPEIFLNMILDDGTGEIGVTINRYKYEKMGAAIWEDQAAEGKLYMLRGTCINATGRWLMVDDIVNINDIMENDDDDRRDATGDDRAPASDGEAARD